MAKKEKKKKKKKLSCSFSRLPKWFFHLSFEVWMNQLLFGYRYMLLFSLIHSLLNASAVTWKKEKKMAEEKSVIAKDVTEVSCSHYHFCNHDCLLGWRCFGFAHIVFPFLVDFCSWLVKHHWCISTALWMVALLELLPSWRWWNPALASKIGISYIYFVLHE